MFSSAELHLTTSVVSAGVTSVSNCTSKRFSIVILSSFLITTFVAGIFPTVTLIESDILPAVAVIVAVPSERPLTTPVSASTVATFALSVLHATLSFVFFGVTEAFNVTVLSKPSKYSSPCEISTAVAENALIRLFFAISISLLVAPKSTSIFNAA